MKPKRTPKATMKYRRSLKTFDSTLAKVWVQDLQSDVARLSITESGPVKFDELAERWLSTVRHTIKESTRLYRKICPKAVGINARRL
jgi:hypothetical protein